MPAGRMPVSKAAVRATEWVELDGVMPQLLEEPLVPPCEVLVQEDGELVLVAAVEEDVVRGAVAPEEEVAAAAETVVQAAEGRAV